MITPQLIRMKAIRIWQGQIPLRSEWTGQTFFPVEIPVGKPSSRELLENFVQFRKDIQLLEQGCKVTRGHGFDIEFERLNHRQLGEQLIPKRIIINSIEDLAFLAGTTRQLTQWRTLSSLIVREQPLLRVWIAESPLKVIEHAEKWDSFLRVLKYFLLNPRPNLYIRQLDIEGVDTKFIEQNKGILRSLLDAVLPSASIDTSQVNIESGGFERRYGLRFDEVLIRFRILDQIDRSLPFGEGTSIYRDLSVPVSEFAKKPLNVKKIFIVENKINALAFPEVPDSVVIFGSGYAVRALRQIQWLAEYEIIYWGDLDTHGFAILAELRSFFPKVRSLIMDETTLMRFQRLWGMESVDSRYTADLEDRLTSEENNLFCKLRDNVIGECLRLEQERIPFHFVLEAIAAQFGAAVCEDS